MKDLFGVCQKKKDGTEGLKKDIPPIRELQESPIYRDKWITYSCKDAIATWLLHDRLVKELMKQDWEASREKKMYRFGNMYEFYRIYLICADSSLTSPSHPLSIICYWYYPIGTNSIEFICAGLAIC